MVASNPHLADALAMGLQVTIKVHNVSEPTQRAWLTLTVYPGPPKALAHDLDVARALTAGDPTASGDIPRSHLQILRSEIAAGVLTAKRKAPDGITVVLDRLGGSNGDQGVSSIASIGFAVAATLAVLHGAGVEDLLSAPHGGHGWELDECIAEVC